MPRSKITVEYDGTNLLGWQRQLDGPSVQEHLENALLAFTGHHSEICAAGRTDAGVHALGQVAHFDTYKTWDLYRLKEAFNAHLRTENAPVVVISAEETTPDFHARFSAVGRGYIYRILNRPSPSIILQNRVWWVPYSLNIEAMRQGAKHLLGHHDFSSFRASACQAKSPLKTLDKLDIERQNDEIIFTVEARSFLHHQVRNMVGTLKMLGNGYLKPQDIITILEKKDRKAAGVTAPACGLYLNKVMY
ncbi:MAG: tRNA pseudouridine(38-40) synthase TruA [Alphaproteobacteria bacterium]|nr:tRNA pseudouridine(38-40) synthase TruA [Alphaproteobacteria bacterium]